MRRGHPRGLEHGTVAVWAASFAVAAATAGFLLTLLPDARALDVLVCIRFYLAHGCLP